ncbi:glutaminase A [Lachnospiraceae bacterium 45-P1]
MYKMIMEEMLEQSIEIARPSIARGEVATYIPELGKVDKNQLGICVFTKEGERFFAGDTTVRFSIQSISKVISLAAALEHCGFDTVFEQIGMEPSGDAFNSLIKLESSNSHPYNPMINSGAIAICGYLVPVISFEEMTELARTLCRDDGIIMDEKVYQSEMSHISRNRAIAYLLESKGVITSDVEKTLDFYVRMCSLSVTAESLAELGLLLANRGIQLSTGRHLLKPDTVRVVKTIMMTCGMYDGSGEFAVRVGLPSKSGVGGGILSVADRKMGIGIFGPALDKKGNSIAGERMLQYLSEKLNLHMMGE